MTKTIGPSGYPEALPYRQSSKQLRQPSLQSQYQSWPVPRRYVPSHRAMIGAILKLEYRQ
jgi:hypothetical protein